MSGYNGNGVFSYTYSWTNDAANGIPITASRMDTQFADSTGGFNNVICRDGQSTTTSVIPFAAGISIGGGASLTTLDRGIFTPTDASGAALAITVSRAVYTQIGTRVFVELAFSYPATGSGLSAKIGLGALPSAANVNGVSGAWFVYWGGGSVVLAWMLPNTNTLQLFDLSGAAQQNSGFSGATLRMQFNYATA